MRLIRIQCSALVVAGAMTIGLTPQDGHAALVEANFNASPLVTQPSGTVTAADLNAGTTGGTWTATSPIISQILQQNGNASNRALAADRGTYNFSLAFDTVPTLAANPISFSFDTEVIRTLSGAADANKKKNFLIGYDSTAQKLFEIVITIDGGSNSNRGRLRYVDSTGTEQNLATALPSVNNNPSNFTAADFRNVRIEMSPTSMDIYVANTLIAPGVAYRTAGVTDFASISLLGSGTENTDVNVDAGAWYDNIQVTVVPEPSSALLAGLACGLLGTRRRRRT